MATHHGRGPAGARRRCCNRARVRTGPCRSPPGNSCISSQGSLCGRIPPGAKSFGHEVNGIGVHGGLKTSSGVHQRCDGQADAGHAWGQGSQGVEVTQLRQGALIQYHGTGNPGAAVHDSMCHRVLSSFESASIELMHTLGVVAMQVQEGRRNRRLLQIVMIGRELQRCPLPGLCTSDCGVEQGPHQWELSGRHPDK
jgi:hypothetical protein